MSGYQKSCLFCGEKIRLSNDIGNRWLPYNLDNSPHECREPVTTKNNNNKVIENTTSKVKITLSLDYLDKRITQIEQTFEQRLKRIEHTLYGN